MKIIIIGSAVFLALSFVVWVWRVLADGKRQQDQERRWRKEQELRDRVSEEPDDETRTWPTLPGAAG